MSVISISCSNKAGSADTSTSITSSSGVYFPNSYKSQLMAEGLSADEAEYFATDIGAGSAVASSDSQKAVFGISVKKDDDNEAVAASSRLHENAMSRVDFSQRYPTVESKHRVIEKIAKAHACAVHESIKDSVKAKKAIEQSTESALKVMEKTGLAGSDLAIGLHKYGKGLVDGLKKCSRDSNAASEHIKSAAFFAAKGLQENKNLNSSSNELIGSFVKGAMNSVCNSTSDSHSFSQREKFVENILVGTKEGLKNGAGLNDSDCDRIMTTVKTKSQEEISQSPNLQPALDRTIVQVLPVVGTVPVSGPSIVSNPVSSPSNPSTPSTPPAGGGSSGSVPVVVNPPPAPVVPAAQCQESYDTSFPAGITDTGARCSGYTVNTIDGQYYSSSPVLHTIDMYETSSNLHGLKVLSSSPLIVQSYRLVGTTTIQIAEGSTPIYLALRAYEPTQFVIQGAVSRIVKVFVVGYSCQSVVGVDASKVIIDTYKKPITTVLDTVPTSPSYSAPGNFVNSLRAAVPELSNVPLGSARGVYSSVCFGGAIPVQ